MPKGSSKEKQSDRRGGVAGDGFRRRLAALQKARGFTQAGLADAAERSPSVVTDWYAGQTYPDATALRNIAKKTGVSLDWLLMGSRDGGAMTTEVQYRAQDRTHRELEYDLSAHVQRALEASESANDLVPEYVKQQARDDAVSAWCLGSRDRGSRLAD